MLFWQSIQKDKDVIGIYIGENESSKFGIGVLCDSNGIKLINAFLKEFNNFRLISIIKY